MQLAVLCGLLPILLGVAILHLQAKRTLEHSTSQTATEAVRQFDLMLDNTARAAQELLPLAGKARSPWPRATPASSAACSKPGA